MAATLYGAVKAYLEAQGLGISVFRDLPPPAHRRPYVVMQGDIAMRTPTLEDGGVNTVAEEIQLDLYETWRGQNEQQGESSTLADTLTAKLHGLSLNYGTPAKQVYGLLQRNRVRVVDMDGGQRVVRHIYQIDAERQI